VNNKLHKNFQNTKKTILHIIPNFIPGGAENQLKLLVEESLFYNHVIISIKDNTNIFEASKLRNNKNGRIRIINLRLKLNPISLVYAVIILLKTLKKYHPRIIQYWMYHSQFLSLLISLIYKTKVIWCIRHGSFSSKTKFSTRIISKINSVFSKIIPDLIIYNSKRGKEIHESNGYSNLKSKYIFNGGNEIFKFSNSNRKEFRREFKFSEKIFMVGSISRYSPQKSHDILLECFSYELKNKKNAKLLLCGRGIDRKNTELICQLKKYDIENSAILCGYRSDINKILNGIDLYISTSSFGEGFPNIILEASYTGLPIIATDVGDTKKIISKKGILLNIGDKESLKKNIRNQYKLFLEKLENDEKYFLDRKILSDFYRTKFTTKEMVKKYINEWENLLCI
tara:strand:- start:25667 stop:26860 length:1194 start_codon:yes stop_codon:yes gene_type:complete